MYESEIPKSLVIGEIYTGEQLSHFIATNKQSVIYTDESSQLAYHVKHQIISSAIGYQHSRQDYSTLSETSPRTIFFAKVVR